MIQSRHLLVTGIKGEYRENTKVKESEDKLCAYFSVVFCRPLEVRNGVGAEEELYGDSGYDYYTNQGVSQ